MFKLNFGQLHNNANSRDDQNKLWSVNLTIAFIGFGAKQRVGSNYYQNADKDLCYKKSLVSISTIAV